MISITPQLPTPGEAAARRVLAALHAEITAGIEQLRLTPGDDHTTVHGMYPVAVIGRAAREAQPARSSYRNESRIRWAGRTLVVDEPFGGATFTVVGHGFEDGVARVPLVPNPNGGLLVFRIPLVVTISPTFTVTGALGAGGIDLIHAAEWPAAQLPTVSSGGYNMPDDAAIVSSTGYVHQLCAVYDATLRVTTFKMTPELRSLLGGGIGSGRDHYDFIS